MKICLQVSIPNSFRSHEPFRRSWCRPDYLIAGRVPVLAQRDGCKRRHLVIARHKPDHKPVSEWVYNKADIEHARIVWAREIDSAHNDELIRYFKDRQAWLLQPDETLPKLSAYPMDQAVGEVKLPVPPAAESEGSK